MSEESNGWETFEKIGYRAAEMAVRVYKGGQMALTKAVHDSLGSNSVELLYNKDLNKIGIRPVLENSKNAYNLRKPSKQNSWLLSASAFLKYYGLEDLKGNKYPATLEDDMVVVDITEPDK